jgi:hypothetical protein
MSNMRTLRFSFASGEVTPEMFGRVDAERYSSGVETAKNFITLPHGPASARPGFEFIGGTKIDTKRSRLIPFSFNATQTYALEFGDQYIRIWTQGGQLTSEGVPVEISSPYLEADLFDLHYVQSADVMTITHPNYAAQELRRTGALTWTLGTISTGPTILPPTGVGATPTGTGGTPITHTYVVTAVAAGTLEESYISFTASASLDLSIAGNYITLTWSAATGAIRYNVYKALNGDYGYVGETGGLLFVDDNIKPDGANTPQYSPNVISGTGNYPAAVSYHEQRRVFGGSDDHPQTINFTHPGTESNFGYSIPTQDDDAISVTVKAREVNRVRHLVPLGDLIALTTGGEWLISSGDSFAITPSSIRVRPQGYVGASNVQPAVTENSALYAQAEGGHVRELTYDKGGALRSLDVSLLATHLFDYHSIVDMAFAKGPTPILWAVRNDGVLLGMTYLPGQQVIGWHQHDTAGTFESACCITENGESALYVIVHRTVGGTARRYVERLKTRYFATLADAFCVDSGLSYSGAPTSTISGLNHLEGKTVSILADGAVHPPRTVVAGGVTLDAPASKIHVGLPIIADLKTLPLVLQMEALGQGRFKNINKAWLRVHRSSGVFVGPSFDRLTEAKQRTNEPYGSPPALKTDEMEVMTLPAWTTDGAICVRQSDPLPLTVVSMALEAAVGG